MPFDHFNLLAKVYDHAAPYSLTEAEVRFLDLPVDGRALDVGGGTGRVAVALLNSIPFISVLDTSLGMLAQAVAKGLPAVRAPAENLPFIGRSFSRIILRDSYHHLKDQDKAARELWRILAPGGRIVVIEPDILRFTVKILAMIEKILLMRSHFSTAERIIECFDYPEARATIHREAGQAWVVVEKVR